MNKKIGYRFYDYDSKKMIYLGDNSTRDNGYVECFIEIDMIGMDVYVMEYGDNIPRVLSNYETMDYTGVNDKNGKEIYVGDILKFYNDTDYKLQPGYAKVIFENGAYCCKHFKYGIEYLGKLDIDDMDITVAGNIYENIRLIKD